MMREIIKAIKERAKIKTKGKIKRFSLRNNFIYVLSALLLLTAFSCGKKKETQEISITIIGTAKIEGKEDNSGISVFLEKGISKLQTGTQSGYKLEYQSVASTTTEKDGSYVLFANSTGIYRIRLSAKGYIDVIVPNIVLSGSGVYEVSPVIFTSALTEGAFGEGTTTPTEVGGTTISELEKRGVIIGYVFLPGATEYADLSGTIVELLRAELKSGEVVYSPVATQIVQKDGKFMFENVPFGTYSLRITREGFPTYLIPNIVLASKIYDVGKITLPMTPGEQVIAAKEGVLDFKISWDGKLVAWRDSSGTLFLANPSLESKEAITRQVLTYDFVRGSTLVFMTSDRNLYIKQYGNLFSEKISSDVKYYLNVNDIALAFLTLDEKLYIRKFDGNSLGFIDSDVQKISLLRYVYGLQKTNLIQYEKNNGEVYLANTETSKRKIIPTDHYIPFSIPYYIHKDKMFFPYVFPNYSTIIYVRPYDLSSDPIVVDKTESGWLTIVGFFDLGMIYWKASSLYFYSYASGTTSKVKDFSYSPEPITSVGNEFYFKDGDKIYYFDGNTFELKEVDQMIRDVTTYKDTAMFYLKIIYFSGPSNVTFSVVKFNYQNKSTQVIGNNIEMSYPWWSEIYVSPDGNHVIVSGSGNIFSVKTDGSGVVKLNDKINRSNCSFNGFARDVTGKYIGKIAIWCSPSLTPSLILKPDGTDIFKFNPNTSYRIYSDGNKIVWIERLWVEEEWIELGRSMYISDLREGATPIPIDTDVYGMLVLEKAGKILYAKREVVSFFTPTYTLKFVSLNGDAVGTIDSGVNYYYYTTPEEDYVIYTKWVFELEGNTVKIKNALSSARLK